MSTNETSNTPLAEYRKKPEQAVVAVRLDLDTDGFCYRKWGGTQQCKAGDWLVTNGDETYTVDADSFAATYEQIAKGRYRKTASVWAMQAQSAGSIPTREGESCYAPGDYLVSNDPDGIDTYAVSKERFEATYERAK